MAEILLTCNTGDFDNALALKFQIQRNLGITVRLKVEDDSEIEDEGFDAMIEQATVLLVFDFYYSRISAWVTIKGIDMADSNYVETDMPDKIDFRNVAKGIAVLDNILYHDFGLDLRPPTDYKQYQAQQLAHEYNEALKI